MHFIPDEWTKWQWCCGFWIILAALEPLWMRRERPNQMWAGPNIIWDECANERLTRGLWVATRTTNQKLRANDTSSSNKILGCATNSNAIATRRRSPPEMPPPPSGSPAHNTSTTQSVWWKMNGGMCMQASTQTYQWKTQRCASNQDRSRPGRLGCGCHHPKVHLWPSGDMQQRWLLRAQSDKKSV